MKFLFWMNHSYEFFVGCLSLGGDIPGDQVDQQERQDQRKQGVGHVSHGLSDVIALKE